MGADDSTHLCDNGIMKIQIYQVGGAVRDRLLHRPVQEVDWVVVGATPEAMRARNFRQVGKDFPVFLHPETHEEYALARTERKRAPGYHGFEIDCSPEVTLEQDLARRDLTVNAMAMTPAGEIIDPWGGRADLEARLLRHVSPAYLEDPVRILRVARFAARFHALGFGVADETQAMMRAMVDNGEVDALVAERVWQETSRALGEDDPQVFFATLRQCGALARIFPELEALFGVPQPARWHPEIDTGVHLLLVLEQVARLSPKITVRFAALTHDLGKGTTPSELWPSHRGHEQRSVALTHALCDRLRIPNAHRDLAVKVAHYHGHVHRAFELRAHTVLKVIEAVDGLRRPELLQDFLLACEADARGRTGLELDPYPQAELFASAARAAREVTAKALLEEGLSGKALGDALHARRVHAVHARLRDEAGVDLDTAATLAADDNGVADNGRAGTE